MSTMKPQRTYGVSLILAAAVLAAGCESTRPVTEGYYRQLLDLKLATYQYRGAPTPRTHLGVILEDDPAGVWVDGANDRVDLYGYTSLAIAGVQSQADELAALRGELKALRAELAAVKAGRCE